MALEYGLIGETLGHSFSPQIHAKLGGYAYDLHPLPPEALDDFMRRRPFRGINVTIPYKKAVIPYCSQLTPAAQAIGSVNTIVRLADGTLRGDNTDLYGLMSLARRAGVIMEGKKVVILGTGGTSLTAQAAARQLGARQIVVVSRRGPETYEGLAGRHADAQVLINTTPVGMYPQGGPMAADPRQFPRLEGAMDVIYNPLRTAFVQAARSMGIPAAGGLFMLVAQAKAAAEQFLGRPLDDSSIQAIHRDLAGQLQNIVLVGMPGSGKSSVGALLAQRMGRPFLDLDSLVEQQAGMAIPQIFAQQGEEAFRRLEAQAMAQVGARTGCVIATGGGTVLRPENRQAMAQNGFVVWLQRDLSLLPTEGRPLSAGGPEALEALLRQRSPLYRAASHYAICNSGPLQQTAELIMEAFYEAAGH